MGTKSSLHISRTEQYGAHNYKPLPIVIAEASGAWVTDADGRRYFDMLSAYSALNQGHRHPKIIDALKKQADLVTLTSRAFYSDVLGDWYARVAQLTNKQMVLPMNTGAEAVETAIKAARRWGYDIKGVEPEQARIIGCSGNFHGRTMAAISLSSEAAYKRGFEPLLAGFDLVPYGDIDALRAAITPNTVAFIVEPIQGEAGIIIPPKGYLHAAAALCREMNVLFIADEIQTGLGRTGKLFACEWEQVVPDMYVLGKALGGGVLPISAVTANADILGVFDAGSHGSTFGGNPLACAVSLAALDVIEEEQLVARSATLGEALLTALRAIKHPAIRDVRGRGLFIGVELHEPARPYCERLAEVGILCKETHETVIRFAPPLILTDDELAWAIAQIQTVFA